MKTHVLVPFNANSFDALTAVHRFDDVLAGSNIVFSEIFEIATNPVCH